MLLPTLLGPLMTCMVILCLSVCLSGLSSSEGPVSVRMQTLRALAVLLTRVATIDREPLAGASGVGDV